MKIFNSIELYLLRLWTVISENCGDAQYTGERDQHIKSNYHKHKVDHYEENARAYFNGELD